MSANENNTTAGYCCKECGKPSPIGVGYVDNTPGAAAASAAVIACPCGYGRSASNDPVTRWKRIDAMYADHLYMEQGPWTRERHDNLAQLFERGRRARAEEARRNALGLD